MPFVSLIKGTLRALTRSEALDRELDEELQSYLELLVDEKIRNGMDEVRARREALMELGGVEQVKAAIRHSRHGAALDSLLRDIRHAVRTMRKAPGFTVVVVLTLALGIGANTALFSTINAALIRDIPFAEPDRLVAGNKTRDGVPMGPVSRLDYFDINDAATSFDGLAAYVTGEITVTGEAAPEVVGLMLATWNLLPVLGVDPVVGRNFLREEELAGGSESALISHRLWQRRFGGDPNVVGKSLFLNGEPRTIVGVVPAGFRFMADVDLWIPVERGDYFLDPQRDSHSLRLVGRLKPGVSLAQAQGEVDTITRVLEQQYPDTNKGKGMVLYDLQRYMVGDARTSLYLLMATTALVLLIACGNVAGLLLARGQRRLPEMAMRSALGAPRRRLVRQLVTESVFMTLVAGIAGVGVAVLFQKLLLQLLPLGRPGLPEPSLDATVLLFTLVISVLAGAAVGVIPALRATSFNPWEELKAISRVSEGRRSSRVRNLLVAAQVAIAVVLLIGSGLLIRTMVRLTTADLGFEPHNLLAGKVGIRAAVYETAEQRNAFFTTLVERVETLPGVVKASTISKLPIASPMTDWPIWHADQPRPASGEAELALARWSTPGYFETMGIPILRGRDIASSDRSEAAKVLVISESVADGLFPGQDAIGRMVKLGWTDDPYEIVGIVGDARLDSVRSDFHWAMYMPSAQMNSTFQWLVVKTSGDPLLVSESVRGILHDMDRDVVFADPRSMASIIGSDLSNHRTVTTSLGVLAGIALLLTSIGLYGVLAFHVNQRIGEFGIRVALGAPMPTLMSSVVARGSRMVGAGLLSGMVISLAGTRVMQELLFETDPLDPAVFLGAAAFLGGIALVACVLPAWRVSRVNPVEVLRKE
jgi:putative ABC transport system permease protein